MTKDKELGDRGTATMIRNRDTGMDHVVIAVEEVRRGGREGDIARFYTVCHNFSYDDIYYKDAYPDPIDSRPYLDVYDSVEKVDITRVCGHCMIADLSKLLGWYKTVGLDIDRRTREHTRSFDRGNRTILSATDIERVKELQEKYNVVVRKREAGGKKTQ